MKRPNKTGSILKLSGKRRRPYAARVFVGYKENSKGQMIAQHKYIGYYEKQAEALAALEKYNVSPTTLYKETEKTKKHTFKDIYDMWMDELSRKSKPLSKSTLDCYKSAYKNLSPLHDMVFELLTVEDLEEAALMNSNKSSSTMKNIKITLKGMYKTALRHRLVSDDLSALLLLHATNENSRPHTIFTDEEIETLWEHKKDFYAKILLILIYTGMRINELLLMKSENVNLEERYMTGGLKTDAGRNRQIPIAKKIVPLLDLSHEYLISENGEYHVYTYYNDKISNYLKSLGMSHQFHDTRHTTATLMERHDIPLLHRKLILGHSTSDVTDLYTHPPLDRLLDSIDKL